jgi:hypothetical protein
MDWDGNFYLIGSTKRNKATAQFMEEMHKGCEEGWRFIPEPAQREAEEQEWRLVPCRGCKPFHLPPRDRKKEPILPEDYGLILRGPHPRKRGRMVTILAGTHSLGTGAACLAATNSKLIKQIEEIIPNRDHLKDQKRILWVLCKGVLDKDHQVGPENVTIWDAGVYG